MSDAYWDQLEASRVIAQTNIAEILFKAFPKMERSKKRVQQIADVATEIVKTVEIFVRDIVGGYKTADGGFV